MKKANQELKGHIKSRFGTILGCLMTFSSVVNAKKVWRYKSGNQRP